MTFCARICESNMSRWTMRATPDASSANEIGMPIAMASSREPRKIEMVMVRLRSGGLAADALVDARGVFQARHVFRFADHHELVVGQLAAQRPQHVEQQQGP